MTKRIPDRLNWAVEILSVDPADRLLEVGCGTGVAVALICEKLVSGKITAIDQSGTMIQKATSANRQNIDAGRAVFQVVSLADTNFGKERFNKIFAFNVNVFWQQPAEELFLIKSLLKRKGSFYLFYQPPYASKMQEIVEKSRKNLLDNGFAIKDILSKELKPAPVVCIIAEAT